MEKQILATDQIANINNGFFDSELGQAIAEAVAAVLKHGRKATVTAKLEISVQNLSNGTVKIMHDVKSTLPKEKREGGILFVTLKATSHRTTQHKSSWPSNPSKPHNKRHYAQ